MTRCTGAASGPPRRLITCTASPVPDARRTRRSGAGEDWAAHAAGLNRKAVRPPASAANCKRRNNCVSVRRGNQASKASTHPAWRICWQTQRESAPRSPLCLPLRPSRKAADGRVAVMAIGASTTTSRARSMPAAHHAGACKSCGGCTAASQPPRCVTAARAGNSRVSSPMPMPSSSSSTSEAAGQPCPGSTASSSGKPVAKPRSTTGATALPRQTSARARTSAREAGVMERGHPGWRGGQRNPAPANPEAEVRNSARTPRGRYPESNRLRRSARCG